MTWKAPERDAPALPLYLPRTWPAGGRTSNPSIRAGNEGAEGRTKTNYGQAMTKDIASSRAIILIAIYTQVLGLENAPKPGSSGLRSAKASRVS